MCKVVILNGCLPESEVSKKLEIFKSNFKGETKEVFLYQLNIKATESRDGMDVIYQEVAETDAILVACESELDKTLELAVNRMKTKFVNSELENKIFGAILEGDDLNKELASIAFSLGMITNVNCFASNADDLELEIKNVAETLYNLSSMLGDIHNEPALNSITDEHTDALQEEDPLEQSFDFNNNDGADITSPFSDDDNMPGIDDENEEEDDEDELEENEVEDESEEGEIEPSFESFKLKLKSFDEFMKSNK